MLNFIYYPVSAILWFWHLVFGFAFGASSGVAWALAVVFLVFTLRALLFKPFVSQVRSMRKMQEFQPEIKKLQAKYKGDRQTLAKEMQKLQQEHGVSPLGGCLPVLVQLPVFIGLYHVLRSFVPGHTENYIFDAAGVNSFVDANIFGAKLSTYISMPAQQLAAFGTTRSEIIVVAVPLMIIASIATHITARHSAQRQTAAAAANPQAAIMNKLTQYVFPLGVLVGGLFFPLAILLYWLANNSWTLMQQYVVYRRIEVEEQQKKDIEVQHRQALGPKPGQKPTHPKRVRPAGEARQGAADLTDASPLPMTNGSAADKEPTAARGAGPAKSLAGQSNAATSSAGPAKGGTARGGPVKGGAAKNGTGKNVPAKDGMAKGGTAKNSAEQKPATATLTNGSANNRTPQRDDAEVRPGEVPGIVSSRGSGRRTKKRR